VTETNVFQLTQPGRFSDPLTEVLRNGARALLGQAVEAEVAVWLSTHTDKLTDDGRRRLVRHGHLPEREIMTGIGAVAVRCARARDRVGEGGGRIRFSSTILPPYARRSKSLEVLIPILYLKGISTGDFEEALIALLGKDAGGLSASTIGRLKEAWSGEHTRWSKRDGVVTLLKIGCSIVGIRSNSHAAATTSRHARMADALKARCVLAEVR
jgi:putative transposase